MCQIWLQSGGLSKRGGGTDRQTDIGPTKGHCSLPVYLQSLKLEQNSSVQNINTRGQHTIHTTRVQQEFAKQSLRYTLPRSINNTPNKILNKIYTHSLHGVATYIKIFISTNLYSYMPNYKLLYLSVTIIVTEMPLWKMDYHLFVLYCIYLLWPSAQSSAFSVPCII